MKYELLMECRGGTRHAFRTVMIVVLRDNTFKMHQVCRNCESQKFPVWNTRGAILKSPTYKHSPAYREFLNDHDPAEARAAIISSDIRKVQAPNERNNPKVRLVSKSKKVRNRHARTHKRRADKKWRPKS